MNNPLIDNNNLLNLIRSYCDPYYVLRYLKELEDTKYCMGFRNSIGLHKADWICQFCSSVFCNNLSVHYCESCKMKMCFICTFQDLKYPYINRCQNCGSDEVYWNNPKYPNIKGKRLN